MIKEQASFSRITLLVLAWLLLITTVKASTNVESDNPENVTFHSNNEKVVPSRKIQEYNLELATLDGLFGIKSIKFTFDKESIPKGLLYNSNFLIFDPNGVSLKEYLEKVPDTWKEAKEYAKAGRFVVYFGYDKLETDEKQELPYLYLLADEGCKTKPTIARIRDQKIEIYTLEDSDAKFLVKEGDQFLIFLGDGLEKRLVESEQRLSLNIGKSKQEKDIGLFKFLKDITTKEEDSEQINLVLLEIGYTRMEGGNAFLSPFDFLRSSTNYHLQLIPYAKALIETFQNYRFIPVFGNAKVESSMNGNDTTTYLMVRVGEHYLVSNQQALEIVGNIGGWKIEYRKGKVLWRSSKMNLLPFIIKIMVDDKELDHASGILDVEQCKALKVSIISKFAQKDDDHIEETTEFTKFLSNSFATSKHGLAFKLTNTLLLSHDDI